MDSDITSLRRKVAMGDQDAQAKLDRKLTRADIPQKVYVINRVQWEYNDEYHYTEGNGGSVLVYRDKAAAMSAMLEKEFEAFKNTFVSCEVTRSWGTYNMAVPVGDYYPSWNMEDDLENIPQELYDKLGRTAENIHEFRFPADADDADVRALQQCLSIRFFELEEVDFYG